MKAATHRKMEQGCRNDDDDDDESERQGHLDFHLFLVELLFTYLTYDSGHKKFTDWILHTMSTRSNGCVRP